MNRQRRPSVDGRESRNIRREELRRRKRIKKRRKERIFRIGLILVILLALVFAVRKLTSSNKKIASNIETAIKSYDEAYFDKNMDRMDVIMDALKKSYSKDEKEEKEFYEAAFKNLSITYIEEKKVEGGKELSLEIENVNYIDVYNSLEAGASHEDYINALSSKDYPKKKARVSIFVRNKMFSKKIYESRPFVNAILGGALDYAK
ncbi:MAG: hypothetical protein MRZ08_01410 [Anaerococcus sp.]|uniref:hypothetical protein n=1 Tax=Anaerococcus sp. TaxID=1872515 RepID=UPI00262E0F8D|nr:hypothetical protein [Anaerococcus sp.]MCI5971670.1 hypothetical protein [Anaerococcus sp.]MDD6918169.1 hypothetical protein [Peptoniphilaceae bacterium]